MQFKGTAIAICVGFTLFSGGALAQETNLLALGEGTLPVVEPPSYSGWGPVNVLDDSPRSAWASANGHTGNNVFVFETLAPATIEAFEFDCTVDGKGRGPRTSPSKCRPGPVMPASRGCCKQASRRGKPASASQLPKRSRGAGCASP